MNSAFRAAGLSDVLHRIGLSHLHKREEILAAEHKLEALEGAVGLHKLHSAGDGDQTESTGATAVPRADASSPGRDALSSGGALALAILCNKALFPIRAPFTLAVTPTVSRYLNRLRRIT
eukprot:SM000131S26707  [mRNA]  locus=s131:130711:131212:- [translate_table: standard]